MTKTFNELLSELANNFGKVIHYNRHSIITMSDDGYTMYAFEYDVKYHEGSVLPYYYVTTGKKYIHDKKEKVVNKHIENQVQDGYIPLICGVCPKCGWEDLIEVHNYCSDCGQRLDWEEVEQ